MPICNYARPIGRKSHVKLERLIILFFGVNFTPNSNINWIIRVWIRCEKRYRDVGYNIICVESRYNNIWGLQVPTTCCKDEFPR